MRQHILLGVVGIICITLLGAVYMDVFNQDGTVLIIIGTSLGAIIGGLAGHKLRRFVDASKKSEEKEDIR